MKDTLQQLQKLPPWLKGDSLKDVAWLVLMSLMLFMLLLPFSSYIAALPLIKDEWGLNNTQAGAIYSAYLGGYACSALFIMPLTDRYGPGRILLWSSVVSVVSHVLFPLVARDTATASILRAIAGVGLVGVYMPGLRIISERFAQRGRGTAMGLFVTAFYASYSVSLAATGALMSPFPWRQAYLVLAIASGAGSLLAYALLRGHRHTPASGSSGRLDMTVLKNRPVRLLVLGYSMHAVELYAMRVWLPAFLGAVLVTRGMEPARAAVTAATIGGISLAAGSIGPVMGGMISDRFGRATSAAVIFTLSGACSWAIGWIGGLPWAIILGVSVVYGWAVAADSAIYSTGVTEVAAPDTLGSAMAVQSFLGFMGGVVGPILFGGVLDLVPPPYQWGVGFSCIGALALVAIAGLLRLRALARQGALAGGWG